MNKICKTCNTDTTTKWYSGPICVNCYKKQNYKLKPNKAREASKRWREANKDKARQSTKDWLIKNKEKMIQYRIDNKEKFAVYQANNREHIRERQKQYSSVRYRKSIEFKVAAILRSRLNCAIKNNQKTGSAVTDLGCSIEDFKLYIESLFKPGMSWENWGRGIGKWNLDHINPLCGFDLSNRQQLIDACHYTNLQPLWTEDHLAKTKKDLYEQ